MFVASTKPPLTQPDPPDSPVSLIGPDGRAHDAGAHLRRLHRRLYRNG